MITDYYLYEKQPGARSRFRLDCVASTGNYQYFEEVAKRAKEGRPIVYLFDGLTNYHGKANKFEKMLTDGKNSISGLCVKQIGEMVAAVGDVRGTKDAILLYYDKGETRVEIFVARGWANQNRMLFGAFFRGELTNEILGLRTLARKVEGRPQKAGKANN